MGPQNPARVTYGWASCLFGLRSRKANSRKAQIPKVNPGNPVRQWSTWLLYVTPL